MVIKYCTYTAIFSPIYFLFLQTHHNFLFQKFKLPIKDPVSKLSLRLSKEKPFLKMAEQQRKVPIINQINTEKNKQL